MFKVTVAICTYNRADILRDLILKLRNQHPPFPFEILVVNNNSTDHTGRLLYELSLEEGVPLRVVNEKKQGIVPARNRAIEESLESDYLIFIDDDELPGPAFVANAVDALSREGADCVGGRILVQLDSGLRPAWLGDDLLKYLGKADYGDRAFWIKDESTPVWTGNAGYRMEVFSKGLRFDHRFNRAGKGIGGGEDTVLFDILLKQGKRIRHRPDMIVSHLVEDWRLQPGYFLKLSYKFGRKLGISSEENYPKELFGVPPFIFIQTLFKLGSAIQMWIGRKQGYVRQAMRVWHNLGFIEGRLHRFAERRWTDVHRT